MTRELYLTFSTTGRGHRRKTVARCARCDWDCTSSNPEVVYGSAADHIAEAHSVDVPEDVVEEAKAIYRRADHA